MRKLAAISLLCLSFSAYALTPHYAIVVDAGSSGSRLHLFQYDDAKPLPVITDIFSENITPGLSSFANQPENAGISLKKLFDDAAEKLKTLQVDQKEVSVEILATAGMRFVPTEIQQAIYQNINHYLSTNYHFNIQRIETISGKMEGVYGWLDVNYLGNRFNGDKDITFGTIDMGGASSEIVFSTTDLSKLEDEMTLTIAGNTYTVFSKSILGSGQDKIREAMNKSPDVSACYPLNYKLNEKVTGRFHYATCSSTYGALINGFFHTGDLPPFTKNEFIAYSGIYYAFHFFEADQTPAKSAITHKVQAVCNKSWEQLKQEPQYANVPDKYLSTYCANAIYHTDLLFDAYQIPEKQLHVQSKINQKEIDWTLGALLFELI